MGVFEGADWAAASASGSLTLRLEGSCRTRHKWRRAVTIVTYSETIFPIQIQRAIGLYACLVVLTLSRSQVPASEPSNRPPIALCRHASPHPINPEGRVIPLEGGPPRNRMMPSVNIKPC